MPMLLLHYRLPYKKGGYGLKYQLTGCPYQWYAKYSITPSLKIEGLKAIHYVGPF